MGHGIWDPLPSFARIAGAVGLAKEGCYTWIACEGKYEFRKKKKEKKKGKARKLFPRTFIEDFLTGPD